MGQSLIALVISSKMRRIFIVALLPVVAASPVRHCWKGSRADLSQGRHVRADGFRSPCQTSPKGMRSMPMKRVASRVIHLERRLTMAKDKRAHWMTCDTNRLRAEMLLCGAAFVFYARVFSIW
jgi:hypothetical protein